MVILLNDITYPFQIDIDIAERKPRRLPRPLTGLRATPTYEFGGWTDGRN